MLTLQRLLAMMIVLGIIVLVHEFGHFIAARLMKVKVEVFSFGFGKRLFGKKFGETDIRVSLVPLGGYVKMAGEDEYENKDPKPYEFPAKNRAQKMFILFMGPAMNFLLAFFIITIINIGGVEVEQYKSEPPVIGYITEGSPAEKAGLLKGDKILSINGEKMNDWREMEVAFGSNPNENLAVEYERSGKVGTVNVRVAVMTQENLNPSGIFWDYKAKITGFDKISPARDAGLKQGDVIMNVNGKDVSLFELNKAISQGEGRNPLEIQVLRHGEKKSLQVTPVISGWRPQSGATVSTVDPRSWKIGISMTYYAPTVKRSFGILPAIGRSFTEMIRMTDLTVKAITKLIAGKIKPGNLSGPLDIANVSQQAMESGMSNFFLLIAFLSLHIGLLNLLPIPVLDGGHLMIYSIESIIRRDISSQIKIILMNIGFFILIGIMAFAILNDIQKRLPNGWASFLPF